jgi:IS5 family transposase
MSTQSRSDGGLFVRFVQSCVIRALKLIEVRLWHLCHFCSGYNAKNTREENKDIKEGKIPEEWEETPERPRQKDLDARWTKKNGESYYGYKNGICVDVQHGIIRRYDVAPANVHDSQLLPSLLDPENSGDIVWGDSAFAGRKVDELLKLSGYQRNIHDKGSRFNPLDADAKESNKKKSKLRAKVKHGFGCMVTWMNGKLTIHFGLPRTTA